MARITIGLPVFNGEKFLRETLDSLLAQTYSDFELLISDNGSTDGTKQMCEEYAAKDRRVKYYREDVNRGATWNYNRLVGLAHGEYFKWAAHDDLCAPTFLEKCIAVLDRDSTVVLCHTLDVDIDEQGHEVDARRYSHIPSHERGNSPKPYLRFRRLVRDDYDCEQIFGLIRTDVLRKTKLFLSYTDSDRTLLAEIGLYGRLFEIQEGLFFHRQHQDSSCKANPITLGWFQRAGWFDPALQGRILFSQWRQLYEFITAIFRAPLRLVERGWCCFWLMVYYRGRIAGLWKELSLGVRLKLARFLSVHRSAAQPVSME